MTSTKLPEQRSTDFSALAERAVPDKRDQQITELQEEIAQLRDARQEERFAFTVGLILLLDVCFFTVMPSFGGPIALLILELLILIPLARQMGVDEIVKLLNRVLERFVSKGNSEE
ncbi:hypothetical protein [Paracoccus isoporae]|uniref:hypothetical protein n=1 Tax=Paracoccus isoporae TaxID=591205 RepID=UPI00115F8460|nr:hypothetical protein [Paracoccus isoporae]